jgi:multiple sugar transport system substrate-binding protein
MLKVGSRTFPPPNRLVPGLSGALVAALLLLPTTAGAWTYKEAAAPYAGTTINILDEVTPLQETMATLVPEFIEETGIQVNYELLNHFDVISRGQADLLSGRGAYDAILLHSGQMGMLLDADVLRPVDDFLADAALTSPNVDLADFSEPGFSSALKHDGKLYGFLTWNYNSVYWARNDLLTYPAEKEAFKAKYGYELAPAETLQQMRDIAEFFTRKRGETLAGETLSSDFYGLVMEGIKGGSSFPMAWNNILRNFGADIFDAQGRPSFDTPEMIAALEFWAELWNYGPPGMAEVSLIDVPTLMGQGVVAQSLAWSDFALGVDREGSSPHAGQFVYRGAPRNANYRGPRSAETEPSPIIISKASRNPEATYLFLQWMVDRDTQAKLAQKMDGAVPSRESAWSLPIYKDHPLLGSLFKAMQDSLVAGQSKPRAPKIYEIYDALGGLVQEVGLGTVSPEQAAKVGQESMLRICEQCLLD